MHPTVTVALPVLDEEQHLRAALASIAAQTYPDIIEVLVADGGSRDQTREIAASYPGLPVRVLDNPGRIQAAGLNVALREAQGTVFVRVDGHCTLEPDYVERCVATLSESGAALVGGGMTPETEGRVQRGIATAMSSRFGAGPARFHTGGEPGRKNTTVERFQHTTMMVWCQRRNNGMVRTSTKSPTVMREPMSGLASR